MKKIESRETKYKFQNTTLTLDETTGEVISTEVDKKGNEAVVNFTEIIQEIMGIEGLNITISSKDETVEEE